MITLITGSPGSGKSLYTVAHLQQWFKDRPLYVDGIPGLKIDHSPTTENESPANWHDWLPDSGVLIVDECQRIWRPRSSGSAVPPAVQAMETHRKRGADIVLITQHPNLIDPNIRRLVGRHLHVRRIWGLNRAVIYEWDQCSDPGRLRTATSQIWTYPRRVFDLYISATVHTARQQKPPALVWVAVAAVVAFPFVGYEVYQRVHGHIEPVASPIAQVTTPISPGLQVQHHSTAASGGWIPDQFRPRDVYYPESAPAYDGLRSVSAMPITVGCISSAKKCVCYSQQQTQLAVPDDRCRKLVEVPDFNPYSQGGDGDQSSAPGRGFLDVPVTRLTE